VAFSVELAGKTTVVTGASSGIGAAIARRFAESGSHVVLAARRREKLEELAAEITSAGGKALAVPTDVTDYSQVEQLIKTATTETGSVDILVNNAGHAIAKSVVDSTPDEMDAQVNSNLRGLMYGCRAALPGMIAQGAGQIINIGSNCSTRHYPDYAAYVAAKFAVLGFSRSLYEEVREQGVRVNVLMPAAVNTAWGDVAGAELPWPREERLQPDDLAEAALFCVAMPQRVQVESIALWPLVESTT